MKIKLIAVEAIDLYIDLSINCLYSQSKMV